MSKQIKFNIKLAVDGKEQLVTATADTKDLRKELSTAESGAKKFSRSLLDMANSAALIENGARTLKDLSDRLSDYTRSAMQASQQTGLHGSELRKLRADAQAVADTYGYDMQEVLSGTSTMMKGFGVDADTAMRLIRDGLMSGADATGQFFDILGEYPAYFKEAGVSAEQFVAVVTNGAKMGVFSDKAADTVKEGNLRLREMTTATQDALNGIGLDAAKIQQDLRSGLTTTFQVMQQVGAKLKELPSTSAEVGTAIADIFGGPGEDAGLAYIESLSDMELGMESLKASAGATGEAMDSQVSSLSAVNNAMLAVVDTCAGMSGLQPFLGITSQIGMTLVGVGSLVSSLKALNIVQGITAARTGVMSVAMKAYRSSAVTLTAINTYLSGSLKGVAVGATTAKVAIRGLLISTGVGAALAALGAAAAYLMGAFDDAADSAENLSDAEEAAKQKQQEYQQQCVSVRADMEQSIATLKNFNGSKEEEKKLVQQMNDKYGDALGYYDSVSNWYGALVANSEAYCDQMIREIEIRNLANEAAEHKVAMDNIMYNADGSKRKYSNKLRVAKDANGKDIITKEKDKNGEYRASFKFTNDAEEAQASYNAEKRAYEAVRSKMNSLVRQNAAATYKHTSGWSPVKPTGGTGGGKSGGSSGRSGGSGASTEKEKTRIEEIDELIKKKEEAVLKASATEQESIRKDIAALKDEKAQLELVVAAAERPLNLDSLEAIDAEIAYQQKLYNMASSDQIEGVNKTIAALGELREAFEDAGHVAVDPATLKSVSAVEAEMEYWTRQLEKSNDAGVQLAATIQLAALNVRKGAVAMEEWEKSQGNVSIKAAYENDNFGKGSKEDKRKSWANANERVEQLRSDVALHITTEFDAQEEIDKINEQLKALGLEPLKLEVDGDGLNEDVAGAFSSLGNIDLTSFESIRSGLGQLLELGKNSEVSGLSEGFAAAGASASALGDAMQKLGSDSAAAKAGLIASALGQLALSYAAALNDAGKQSWVTWLAFGLSGMATLMTIMQTIGAFAEGGIVGGNSRSGDKLIARVNSGEMILNSEQQARLWKIVNGSYQNIGPRYEPLSLDTRGIGSELSNLAVDVNIHSNTKWLVAEADNTRRVMRKSGRKV